jgi:hypothetical protein
MEMFIASVGILSIWIVCTFINVWCVATMLFLCFDAAYLKRYEDREIIEKRLVLKRNMKLLHGGKKEDND